MRKPHAVRRRLAAVSSVVVLTAMLVIPAASPVAAAVTACTSPPPVFPIDKITNGQTATGWTVLQGTTPESFSVTLLGVLTYALAPGRDAILVKASGANIDAIGGMGPGFSGSPVYRNGQLVGSVSYGLGGDPHYGALTPGQDLVNVLMEPTAKVATAKRIHLTREARRLIARDANVQLAAVTDSMTQIPLPLAVPAETDPRLPQLADRFSAWGVSVIPYHAGSSSSSATVDDTTDPIVPGGVFTAAISYGSVPYAALGTATIVCGDDVVAFGHSFTHGGSGSLGAMLDGEIVATIPAGNDYFPFKMGNIGTLHGSLDQDRLAGVRGILGKMPSLTEVTSTITNLDTGAVSNATTQVARQQWLAGVAADHLYYTLHSALDAHQGTSQITMSIVVRSHGAQYELLVHNAYYGGRAIWGGPNDLYGMLRSIQRAEGSAHVVSVNLTATVTEHRQVEIIHKARTASTTAPLLAPQDTINVHAGDTLTVKVPLEESDNGAVTFAMTTFTIPLDATRDGDLEVSGARPDYWLRSYPLETTIAKLQSQPSTLDLRLEVRFRGSHKEIQYLPQPLPLTGYDDVALNLLRG
jgi:hypothetical protein